MGVGGVPNPPQYLDPMTNMLANNPLASSMQTVARIIAGRSQLGVTRQIFYVQLGSFDTHDNQAVQHARLLNQLGAALEYFDAQMVNMGLGNNVTAFTISDFGRTLTSNRDGTDHGWGSHHFVVGGAVSSRPGYVRPIPCHRHRSGERSWRRPPYPYHRRGAIRWHAGQLVWSFRLADPHRLSQLREFRNQPPSWLHELGFA